MAHTKKEDSSLKNLEDIFLHGVRLQRSGILKKFWRLRRIGWQALRSRSRRTHMLRKEGLIVPAAIGFSPTMRCNLSCIGCYARDYPQGNELPLDAIEALLDSGEDLGIFLFVITGGEPLMREGIVETFRRHKRLLFLLVTNGTLVDGKRAQAIARSRNIVPVVSLEGLREQTDARRGSGVYDQVELAMRHLQDEGAVFGFSATVARDNFRTLSSDEFIDTMIERGCAVGYYTEYIPVGSAARWELVLEDGEREHFRERVLELRRDKPIMVVHLPDDEYMSDGRCRALVYGSVHINAQGYVEPCPFCHFASDTVGEKSLREALRSPFLAEIRSSKSIIRTGQLGCALFENRKLVQDIAGKTGAQRTDCSLIAKD